jgi:hypothetical protein
MHISPRFALFASAPFTLLCLGVALYSFVSMGELTDPELISASRGFVGFWLFLALVSMASGAGCWWLMKTQQRNEDGGNA